jgi:hypothetical protein
VCECLRLGEIEQRELNHAIGVPVAWHGRRAEQTDDEVWRCVPEQFQFLRSVISPRSSHTIRRPRSNGNVIAYFESPAETTVQGRPLPATSLVESISRARACHPFDIAVELIAALEEHSAVKARVIAPVLRARTVALSLTELGHQWWGEDGALPAQGYPELSVSELALRVERRLPDVIRISEGTRACVLGASIEGWIKAHLLPEQLRVFSRTPLIKSTSATGRAPRAFRHTWAKGFL